MNGRVHFKETCLEMVLTGHAHNPYLVSNPVGFAPSLVAETEQWKSVDRRNGWTARTAAADRDANLLLRRTTRNTLGEARWNESVIVAPLS